MTQLTKTPLDVTLLVRSMNRPTLAELFACLATLNHPVHEVIVVNASGKPHAPLPTLPFPARVIEPGEPLTRPQAANAALEAFSTSFGMFIDDDDLIDNDHVDRLAAALAEHPDAPAVYTGVRLVTEHDKTPRTQAEPWQAGALVWRNFLPIHAVLFRQRAVETAAARFDTQLSILEDWDFWLQLSQAGDFVQLPGESATYRLALGLSGLSEQRDIERYQQLRQQLQQRWIETTPPALLARSAACLVDRMEQAEWERSELRHLLDNSEQQRRDSHQRYLQDEATWLDQHKAFEHAIKSTQQQLEATHHTLHQTQMQLNEVLTSRSMRITAPLRQAGAWARQVKHAARTHWQQWRQTRAERLPIAKPKRRTPDGPVDIIVPVYKGLEETRACLESVWAATPNTAYQLIVINDASPEPEVTEWLREVAATQPMTLLENEQNLGFVGTVNRGMAYSKNADVVLLNSDAEVANDWLDRLVAAAYKPRKRPAASVTPFSNNATICSYPRFCEDNPLPEGYDLPRLDALFAATNPGEAVEIPTGIGFCMYIRRDALDDIGLFDEANFGKGYGEENDFCMRTLKAGWCHLHALDVFAWHKGSVSFGESQPERVTKALQVLHQLHPDYDRRVHTFIQQDPALQARNAIDLARLRESPLPRIVLVNHQRGGGTERHCRELTDTLSGQAHWLMLRPTAHGQTRLSWFDRGEALTLDFNLPEAMDELTTLLAALGVSRVHFHHWLGLDSCLMALAERLGVPQDVTLHDYYAVCPQISLTQTDHHYCGEKGLEQCHQCLRQQPAPGNASIEAWRERHQQWLATSERIIAPSQDTAKRIQHYLPTLPVQAIAHPDTEHMQPLAPQWQAPNANEPLRVAVIGALSAIKGADVLEAVANVAKQRSLNMEFKLFGFGYRSFAKLTTLSVTGAYQEEQLPEMLAEWQPHIVWFPAQWPETYSYTLSTCIAMGLPVVSTNLGAQPERLQQRAYSWVMPWDLSAEGWADWFSQLPAMAANLIASSDSDAPTTLASKAQPSGPESVRFYAQHYLANSQPPSILPVLPPWQQHSVSANADAPTLRTSTVSALYWLRERPWLSRVARRIPASWQRKVKSALLKESA